MKTPKKATRNSAVTKERILLEATNEFAAKGFEGARVDSIAARCKLSKNMLYHYFGNKEGLFVATLERMYTTLRANQQGFSLGDDDPVAAMRRLIAHTFRAFADNPHMIWLLNDENKHKGRHIRRLQRIRELYDPLVDTIREIVQRGQEEGSFRPDLDPITLYISLSSLAYHFLSNRYTLRVALGVELASEEAQRRWLVHITEMILAYCRREASPAEAAPDKRSHKAPDFVSARSAGAGTVAKPS